MFIVLQGPFSAL